MSNMTPGPRRGRSGVLRAVPFASPISPPGRAIPGGSHAGRVRCSVAPTGHGRHGVQHGQDVECSRLLLRAALDAVQAARPDLPTSAASLDVGPQTDRLGRRWMHFRFGALRRAGFYSNVFEAEAAGWLAWLEREGIG